jgi:hypothetical protein
LDKLHENGFSLSQTTSLTGEIEMEFEEATNGGTRVSKYKGPGMSLKTKLIHKSGEVIDCGEYPIICSDMRDPQKVGAAVTYARRHSIVAALGLRVEDMDANTQSTQINEIRRPLTSKEEGDLNLKLSGTCKHPGCSASTFSPKTGKSYDYCFNHKQ